MRYALIPAILLFATSACGGSSPSGETGPVSSNSASPSSQSSDTALPASSALAIALEGDVEAVSETEYRAKGPEIRCAAMLVGGEAEPVTSEVDWTADPASAGLFSSGAQGVFFIPEGSGRVEIEARLRNPDGSEIVSPKLILVVP